MPKLLGTNLTEIDALEARIAQLEAELALLRQASGRAYNGGPGCGRPAPSEPGDSEQALALADALPAFVSFVDRTERYRLVNQTYEEWFGLPREAIIGKRIPEVLGEAVYALRKPYIDAALRGERVHYEAAIQKPDGSLRHSEMRYVPRIGPSGEPDGFYVLATDITDRKQAGLALQESEARLHLAVDAGRMAVWELKLATGELTGSGELSKLLGFSGYAAPTLEDVLAHCHPGEDERLKAVAQAALERGDRYVEAELRYNHPDGSARWFMLRAEVRLDSHGQPNRYVGVLLDITGRKQAEEGLKRSEALKSAILEASLDSIVTVTDDSCVVEWNAAAEKTFGYSRQAALGQDLADLIIPPEYREAHRRGMAHFLATGHGPVLGRRIELEALHADGSRFPVELAISTIAIEGKPHFTAYLRDVTTRKAAEAAARESEQRLRATYEHAFVGISEIDPNGCFLRVNEQFCFITGYTREELLARTCWEITHPDDVGGDLERYCRQMAGDLDAYTLEKRYIHKSGRIVWIGLSASKVDDAVGRPSYGVRVVRDITERKRWEEHQKLLINELNHRVKNTLATVQSVVSQTLRNARTAEQAREDLEGRIIALSRAHDVLTRENWEGAHLKEIVGTAIEPYLSRREERFRITGPEVRLTPRMALALAMALQELVTNAVKYGALSNSSGTVEIAWTLVSETKSRRLALRWEEKGGPPVQPPSHSGFGSRLIKRSLAHDLGGRASIDFLTEGVVCTVDAPVA